MVNGRSVFFRICHAFLIWLTFSAGASGQILPTKAREPGGSPNDSTQVRRPARDTAVSPEIMAYSVFRPWHKSRRTVEELPHWHSYDPLDNQSGEREYARLHNVGTAAIGLQPGKRTTIGFDAGFHAYDPYLLSSDSLVMLNAPLAYTDVSYSQGPTSEDGIFAGTLARRFGKGTDFRIDALRIYNFGAYSHMANHHSSLRLGIRYLNPRGKYSLTLLHGNHIIDQEENGGIRTDTLFGVQNYEEEINIPVFLTTADTRYRITDYQVSQAYAVAGKVDRDSLGRLVFFHRMRWQDRSFKFSDPSPASDSLYYGIFQTDQRGIRQYTTWTTFSNTAEVLASWRSSGGTSISFQGGLEHRLHRWNNELRSADVNNVLVLGELNMRWREQADIWGRTQIDVGEQAGSWLVEGRLGLQTARLGDVKAGILLSQRFPDLIQEQLVISQRLAYEREWLKPQQQSLFGSLRIKPLGLSGGVHLGLLTNAIIYTAPGVPDQLTETVAVNQLWIKHHFRIWHLHLNNKISYQNSSDDRIRYPEWVTRHQLYYDGRWFKKTLRAQIGLEARLISAWTPFGFQPVSGQFTLQDQTSEDWFPQLDGYFSMERLGFRAYLQFENIGRAIFGWKSIATNGDEIPRQFSTVSGYPQPEMWMRWGIAFRFRG